MRNIYLSAEYTESYQKYPLVFIDAGASGGIPDRWKKAAKHLQVLGFDCDDRAFKELTKGESSRKKFINAALYKCDDHIRLFLTRKQQCSSIFTPNTLFLNQFPDKSRYEVFDEEVVTGKALSRELLEKEGITDADFMKIDAQGSELLILEGAEEVITHDLFGMEVEVEFAELYCQQPLFGEIDAFLRARGYQIFDLKRYFWLRDVCQEVGGEKGQLIFGDALYLKTWEAFSADLAAKELTPDWKKAKFLKAITVCLIYGLRDYALYLCHQAAKEGIIGPSDKGIIVQALTDKRRKIHFRGQDRLSQIFYRLHLYFQSPKYFYIDPSLGNE